MSATLAAKPATSSLNALRGELKLAVANEHEAWSNVNYWRLEQGKWERRVKELDEQIKEIEYAAQEECH